MQVRGGNRAVPLQMVGIKSTSGTAPAKWPRCQLVDNQVKANSCIPMFSSKVSHLFSKKKECNDIFCD